MVELTTAQYKTYSFIYPYNGYTLKVQVINLCMNTSTAA